MGVKKINQRKHAFAKDGIYLEVVKVVLDIISSPGIMIVFLCLVYLFDVC